MTSEMIQKVQVLTSKLGYGILSSISVGVWEGRAVTEGVMECVELILQCIDPSYSSSYSSSDSAKHSGEGNIASMSASIFMSTAADWSPSASSVREAMLELLLELYPRLLFMLRDRLLALLVEPSKPKSSSAPTEEEQGETAEAAAIAGASAAKILSQVVSLLQGSAKVESSGNQAAGLTEEDAAARTGFAEAMRLDLRGCVLSILSAVRTALDANDNNSGGSCGSPVTAAVRSAVREGLWRGVESVLPILSASLTMPPPTEAEVEDEPTTLAEAVGEEAGYGSADSRKRRVLVSILLSSVRLLDFFVRKDPRMECSEYAVKQMMAKGALRNAITVFTNMPIPHIPANGGAEEVGTAMVGAMDAELLAETLSWQQELQQMLHCCCIGSSTAADFVVRSRGFMGRLKGTSDGPMGGREKGSMSGGMLETSYRAETIVWAIVLSASTCSPPTPPTKGKTGNTKDEDQHGLAEHAFASLDRLLPPAASEGTGEEGTNMLQLDEFEGGECAGGDSSEASNSSATSTRSSSSRQLLRRQRQLSHLHEVLRLLLLLAPARSLLRQWHPLPLRLERLRRRLKALQAEMQRMPRELLTLSSSQPSQSAAVVGAGAESEVGLVAERARMKLVKDGDEEAAKEVADARAVEAFKIRGNDLLKVKELEAAALCYGEGIRLCLKHGDTGSDGEVQVDGDSEGSDNASDETKLDEKDSTKANPTVQGLSLHQHHQQKVHSADSFVPHLRLEAIKCFANRSLAYLQLQQQHKKEDSAAAPAGDNVSLASTLSSFVGQQTLLQQSLADGEQSVVLDETYVKGYFRIAKALQELQALATTIGEGGQQAGAVESSIPFYPMLVEAKKATRIGKQIQKKEKAAEAKAGQEVNAVGTGEAMHEEAGDDETKDVVSKAAIAGVLHKIRRALKVLLQLEGSKSD
jgi:hypothetical protein